MTDQMKVNLVQRLAKATAEVGGKLKADKRNEEQKYNYVSADKILSACGQALAENGVMVIPSIVRQEITMIEYTNSYGKQGKRYDAVVDLQLKVTDGETSFEEPWFGMGSDYSVPDKALYKAITSGHKYFISKLFCIGEGNEDSEHDEPEGQPTKQPANGKPAPVPMLKPLTPLKPVTAEAIVAEITGEPSPLTPPAYAVPGEPPAHVVYTGTLNGYGKRSDNYAFPATWMPTIAKWVAEHKHNAFEVAAIMWNENIAQDKTAEDVIAIVAAHLAAKAAQAQS